MSRDLISTAMWRATKAKMLNPILEARSQHSIYWSGLRIRLLILLRLQIALLFGIRKRTSINLWHHIVRSSYLRTEKHDYDGPDIDGAPAYAVEE
jgi:hypothetical protein